MRAAPRFGHANIAGQCLQDYFVSGAGTAEDPILSKRVTVHCAVFSLCRRLDSWFHGYGHEHIEHSRRLILMSYSEVDDSDALLRLIFWGISYRNPQPSFDGQPEKLEKIEDWRICCLRISFTPLRGGMKSRRFCDEVSSSFPRAML
jgi:hypothetical protein